MRKWINHWKLMFEASYSDKHQKFASMVQAPMIAIAGMFFVYFALQLIFIGYLKTRKNIPLDGEFTFFIPGLFAGVLLIIFAVKAFVARRFTSAAYVYAMAAMIVTQLGCALIGRSEVMYTLLWPLAFLYFEYYQQRKRGY